MQSSLLLLVVLGFVESTSSCIKFDVDMSRGSANEVALHASFQVQAHPLMTAASPLHDDLWRSVETLATRTKYVRYQAWDPYPSYAVPLLRGGRGAQYNFTLLDPLLLDFNARVLHANTTAHPHPRPRPQSQPTSQKAMLNLPVSPVWMWEGTNGITANATPTSIEHPFDHYGNAGTIPVDKSLQELATYFGRVAAWYLAGGFVSDDGKRICSGHGAMPFTYYEVLNEPSYAHNVTDSELYIEYYDRIVLAVRTEVARAVAAGCNNGVAAADDLVQGLKFVGIEQGRWQDLDSARQFFNRSNHKLMSDAPFDAIAWHWYAHLPSTSTPTTTPTTTHSNAQSSGVQRQKQHQPPPPPPSQPEPADSDFSSFFPQVDTFVDEAIIPLVEIRDALAPECEILLNEFGVELPGDIDSPAGSGPGAPPKTWSRPSFQAAAAATFAYAFGRLSKLQVQVLGQSQFIGHSWRSAQPSPMQDMDREYYPGLSMMNWTTAEPLARYRVVMLLAAEIVPGEFDYIDGGIVGVTSSVAAFAYRQHTANVSRNSFRNKHTDNTVEGNSSAGYKNKILLVNKKSTPECLILGGLDIAAVQRSGGVVRTTLLQADGSPNSVQRYTPSKAGTVQFSLAAFQVAVVSL